MKSLSSQSLALLVTAGALFAVSQPVLSASDTDEAIVTAAKNSHVFTTFLKDDHIATESKDGKVTLTGTVAEASHKSMAADTVANLPGVLAVDNQLTINTDPATDNSDWWLSLKVKSMLMFHRNVNVAATGVNAVNGVVTLTGEASSLAQKELTTEYSQDVDGVESVQNNMTVAAEAALPAREQTITEKLDDASITAQIKAALVTHRSTNALTTSVHTTDGVVTVGGVAKNVSEKSLVSKLVNDIHGVDKVVNDMTIPYAGTTSPK